MVSLMAEKGRDDLILELRDWVSDKVNGQGVALATLANEAGINRSLLSGFFNHGRHTSTVLEKLMTLRDRLEKESELIVAPPEQVKSRKLGDIIMTEDFQQAVGICSICHNNGELGVIIGHSGAGKTTALLEFCRDRDDVVMVRGSNTMSVKEMLISIGTGLGLGFIYGSKERMIRTIILALKRNPITIIIDEADQLVDKYSVARLEAIRTIWDHAQVGIVLCGMPKLAKYLVKGPGNDNNLAQIYSRISRGYKMKGASRDELKEILDKYNLTEQAKKYLMARGAAINQGGLRRLFKLLGNALDLVNGDEDITLEVIREAESLQVTPETLGISI